MEKLTTETGENPINEFEPVRENPENKQDSSGVETAVAEKSSKADGEQNFLEMYEESLKTMQEGELVRGEIVQIEKEFILVDIGYKSEGQIPIEEFIDSEGNLTAKVGDKVDVLLEKREDDRGKILLSRDKATKIKIWDDIKKIYEEDGSIKGKIISRIKGGMTVDIGLQAFLPGSQIDLKPIKDFDTLIGTEHNFKILKYNKRRGNIVLSRRAILEAERASLKEETLKNLEEGAVVEGVVKNITDYGLFIDLGGIDGLLHVTDISWGREGHPSEKFQVGDKITAKVLKFDRETERVSLGLKQLTEDPWSRVQENYPIGARIQGRVVSLADYGAFVEVEEGVEGLIHVSEMSWTRKIRHPSQAVKRGDMVDVMVLNIDPSNKRISLGLKQVAPNPWDIIGERYPVGTTIEGKIKNITDFGIFIGIDEGIDGLVHISDLSWTKRIRKPSDIYKKGQEVQAVVLNIDKERERFSLGIKQLTQDPWLLVPEKYRPGTRITGAVTNITDFGVFVELEEGIEGLIHVSELSREESSNPLGRFKVDDVIQAKVINVSRKDKKIGLSVRRLDESDDKDVYKSYIDNKQVATSNLGDLLKEGMFNLQRQNAEDARTQPEAEDVRTEPEAEGVRTEPDAEGVRTEPDADDIRTEPENEGDSAADESSTERSEEH